MVGVLRCDIRVNPFFTRLPMYLMPLLIHESPQRPRNPANLNMDRTWYAGTQRPRAVLFAD